MSGQVHQVTDNSPTADLNKGLQLKLDELCENKKIVDWREFIEEGSLELDLESEKKRIMGNRNQLRNGKMQHNLLVKRR